MIGTEHDNDTPTFCDQHAVPRDECRCGVPTRGMRQLLADAAQRPPREFPVPEVAPVGGVLLAGGPKAGKTTLVLDWAWNIALGSMTMKRHVCPKGDVLLISPEMSDSLIADYVQRLYPTDDIPDGLEVMSAEDYAGHNVREVVDGWLERADRPRMVILDTLQATLRSHETGNERGNVYALDYKVLAGVHKFAEKHNISMVVTHHTNQTRQERGVPWEYQVSGSSGLLAAIGTFMLLRDEGGQHGADWRLRAKGRYYMEQDWQMMKHPVNGAWMMNP